MTITWGECGHPLRDRYVRAVASPRRRRREKIASEVVRHPPLCRLCNLAGDVKDPWIRGDAGRTWHTDAFNPRRASTSERRRAWEEWAHRRDVANDYVRSEPKGLSRRSLLDDAVMVGYRAREAFHVWVQDVEADDEPGLASPLAEQTCRPIVIDGFVCAPDWIRYWGDIAPQADLPDCPEGYP